MVLCKTKQLLVQMGESSGVLSVTFNSQDIKNGSALKNGKLNMIFFLIQSSDQVDKQ